MKIKKIIILPFLLFFVHLSMAQVSFTEPSNRWYVVKSFPDGNIQNPSFMATTTTLYGNNGDTLINSELWKIITSTSDSVFSANPDSVLGFTKTNQNYVLFIENGSSNIDTIYDFNLNIGDSVLYNFPIPLPTYLHVDSIDSVLIGGMFHKKIFFKTVHFPLCCAVDEAWVEGIGSLHGPLFPFYPRMLEIESFDEGNNLTCFLQNDSSIWSHPNYNDCYINITSNIKHNLSKKTIILHPNPTKRLANIDFGNFYKEINIQIIDVSGRNILEKTFNNMNKVSLNMTHQKKGIYFIHIKVDSERAVLKIIKE